MSSSQKQEANTEVNVPVNGSIQIREGKVIVKDPKNNGEKAMIYVHPDLIIRVNGKEIRDVSLVSMTDKVEIMPKGEKGKRILNLRMDEGNLKAYAHIQYETSKGVTVVDSEEVEKLKPQVEAIEEKPKPYTYAEIIEELKSAKVVHGIQKEAIDHLLSQSEKEILVAQGKDAQKGTDGYIEYLFYPKQEEKTQKDINTKINFKNMNELPSVKKGDMIAKRIPPVHGKNGINVFGKVIKVPAVKNPTFTAGNNVKVDDEGLQAISLVDGKPTVRGKVIHVFSVHEVFTDVDIKSGNIDFFGDVIIRGHVKEGMKVKAGHNITVYGSVAGAHLEAGGEILIKNWIVKSTVIAGAQQAELQKLCNYFVKLQGLMLQLFKGSMDVLKTLKQPTGVTLPVGKIVAMVLEKHFNEIPLLLKELKELDKNKIPSIVDEKFYKDIQYFVGKYSVYGVLKIQDIEQIKKDILLMGNMKEKLESQFKQPMNVTIAYAQNAKIKASGDLVITGQGCLNCTVFAGGSVLTENNENTSKPNVFRGGKIQCSKDIRISEIGSTGGARTEIQTGRQGKILFKTLHYNTNIQIGEGKKKIEESIQKGMCFRNNKGDIVIHGM